MRLFRPWITFVLAALWLPAVWHCGLETIEPTGAESGCCTHEADAAASGGEACVVDHCEIFDQGHFRADGDGLAIAPPVPAVLALLTGSGWGVEPRDAQPRVEPAVYPPPELPGVWRFVMRAAPWANAPGSMVG